MPVLNGFTPSNTLAWRVAEFLFFLFLTLLTGPRRSLSLKLSDIRVHESPIRARPTLIQGHIYFKRIWTRKGGSGPNQKRKPPKQEWVSDTAVIVRISPGSAPQASIVVSVASPSVPPSTLSKAFTFDSLFLTGVEPVTGCSSCQTVHSNPETRNPAPETRNLNLDAKPVTGCTFHQIVHPKPRTVAF